VENGRWFKEEDEQRPFKTPFGDKQWSFSL